MINYEKFAKFVGKGIAKTYFVPGELVDESKIAGDFILIIDQNFLQHSYSGSLKGKEMFGKEIYGYSSKQFQCTWVNNSHMGDEIMFLTSNEEDIDKNVLCVSGKYGADK